MEIKLIDLNFSLYTLIVALCVTDYATAGIVQPCKVNDDVCVMNSARAAYPKLIRGEPSSGVQASDPLYVDLIDGNLSILKYTLTSNTFEGFKDCKIDDFKIDISKWTSKMELTCPKLHIYGDYVMAGRLIILPVEGNGTYNIITKNYKLIVNSEIKKSPGKDGVDHLNIKSFKVIYEPKDGVEFHFKNLFNGNKELSKTIHRFANENWKEVVDFVQEPVFKAAFKKIISNANKFLKSVPFDDLFIQ